MIPGCYDPAARLRDMDLDGIHGQLCFPTFPRFSGTLFLEAEDKDLALLCVQAWNDFHLEEWCAHAPDRFIPMMLLPLWDPELCVREIHRCAAKGVRTISFPENTTSLGLGSFHDGSWDPVFAAAQDADLPISMHFGTSGSLPIPSPDSPFSVVISLMGCNSMHTMADLLFSPVFHTFPNLKVALSEGGIGWMPYLLERCDYTWERHMYYTGVNREVPPSELFKKHFWGCFIDDQHGVDSRESIGVDRIMWECDYPHSDSNWPHSRKRVEEQLREVPDNEVHQMVELNARALYRFA
jgi:predicted TIM-barrel fold metal-dependent hydrolase